MALRSVGGLLARPDAGITYFKKMETKRKFIHTLLRESEKDGTKTDWGYFSDYKRLVNYIETNYRHS